MAKRRRQKSNSDKPTQGRATPSSVLPKMSAGELSHVRNFLPLVQAMQTSNTRVRDALMDNLTDEAFDVVRVCVREATAAEFPKELRQLLKDGLIANKEKLQGILDTSGRISERDRRKMGKEAGEIIGDICATMWPMLVMALDEASGGK